MSKHKLIIAEKPSVAQSIAQVLGATTRKDRYFSELGYIVSWCIGHLVELAQPAAYDEKHQKWSREHLPIIPQEWQYVVSKGKDKQVTILLASFEYKIKTHYFAFTLFTVFNIILAATCCAI